MLRKGLFVLLLFGDVLVFGSQTQGGSRFVARMLTVVTTLKSQKRNVLEFMTQTVIAARGHKTAPSLLPEVTACFDDSELLKAA